MNNWKEEILSKKVDLIHGHQFRDNDFVENGIPVVKIGQLKLNGQLDLSGCTYVSFNDIEKFKDYTIKKGDVLMALTGATLGKTIRVMSIPGVVFQNYRVGKFQPIDDSFDKDFLYYLLSSDEIQREMLLKINTAAQGNIGKADFEKIKIKFPEYNIQRQIAKILSTVDAVIEKTQAAISKYKAIKQGMLQDLFTCGIDTTTGKLRPSYQDAPELYKESKLGWIPKEWDEKPLEELATQIGDGIHSTPKYSKNTDYYFINGNNLSHGEIEIGSAQCVTEEEYKKHFKELNNRTILYSINGTIGNIAIYKNEKVILGKSACFITCKSSVNLDYVFFILQTFSIQRFYELEMTGSTIKNLSLASVRNTPIAIPKDDKEQKIIAERLLTIDQKLQAEQDFLHKQQQIKAGLMNDLLGGKKKVVVNDIVIE